MPFALQLARGCAAAAAAEQGWAGELAARAALSEFFKFRGFIADDWERKRALYREALELNPANDNVRKLLADLEGKELCFITDRCAKKVMPARCHRPDFPVYPRNQR